jgi:hypothetical protein
MEDYAVQLITKRRANMSPQCMDEFDNFCLRKRAILESVYDQLKNISQIEHSRHRSLTGLMVNLIAGLVAYCHQPKKPSLNLQCQVHEHYPHF